MSDTSAAPGDRLMLTTALVLLFGVALGAVVTAILLSNRCAHDWAIGQTTQIDQYWSSRDTAPSSFRTDVSMVCRKCGQPRVKRLDGRWHPPTA